jgi:hypothetical protein
VKLIEQVESSGEDIINVSFEQKVQRKADELILLEGTQIPLAALPESGEHTFVIKITDEITGNSASQRTTFTVV